MPAPMAHTGLQEPGLRAEFALVYRPRYESLMKDINEVIGEVTSDKLQEIYGYWESSIYPVRWDPGAPMPSKSILSRRFSVFNRDWARRVYLPRNYEDDQTGTTFTVARGLGLNWATLPERLFYQYITNSTDLDLLPAIPNSGDGNALYLTTTRFGDSGGNVVSQSSSWGTVQNVITDCFSVIQRYLDFQNTESQPQWSAADIAKGVKVFHGTDVTLVAQQAAKQMLTHSVVSSTGAAVSNILISAGVPFEFVNSQRITNTNGYFFLKDLPIELRPLFRQVREGMTEQQGNWETSDHTRDTGEPYLQFKSREGWGSAVPLATIRVS